MSKKTSLINNEENAKISVQVKSSIIYTICSVVQKSLSLITLPFFSRMLTYDEYGLSTMYSSTMVILILFTSLQLPYGTFNTAMEKYEEDRAGYVSSITGLCTLLTLFFMVLYLLTYKQWETYLNIPFFLMVIMVIEMLMSTTLNLWMSYQRYEYHYKKVAIVTMLNTCIATFIGVFAVYFSSSNRGVIRILAFSITTIVIGSVIFFVNITKGKKIYCTEYWRYAFQFNIPLLPYYISQMIFNQSDRLMIDYMCGRNDVAKYGVAYSIALIVSFVINALNDSYTPWLYDKIKTKNFEQSKKVSFALAFFVAFLLLGLIAISPEILYVMAGNKYVDAKWAVAPVAMSLLFLFYTQMFVNFEFYYEEKYYLVMGSIVSAATNIVLNVIFIKRYGYVAAAYTTLISFILFAICNYFCMMLVCKKHEIAERVFDTKKMIILTVFFLALGFLAMFLYNYSYIRYVIIIIVCIGLIIGCKRIMRCISYYLDLFR